MSLDERVIAVFDDFQAGRMSRRQFVRRLAAAGFAGSAIAAFLAACGGTTSPAATPAKSAATSAPAAAAPATTSAPIPTPAPAPTSAPAPTAAAGSAAAGSAAPSTSTATDLGILKS